MDSSPECESSTPQQPAARVTEYARAQPLGSKKELAKWMGYDSVEEMDDEHDITHELLCEWGNVMSYSHAVRDGYTLTDEQYRIAAMEEQAVLLVQRWLQHVRKMNESSA